MGQRILNRGLLERIWLGGNVDRSDVEVGVALLRLTHDELAAYGTDGTQRTNDDEIRLILQICRRLVKRIGISLDLPFSDFRTFRSHWIANDGYGSWQARRDILNALFEPTHRQLAHLEDVAVDLQSPADSTQAPVRVSNGESLRPLAPSSTQMPTPRRQPDITDRVDASADASIGDQKQWDVFISHATEDKETVAGPLANALQARDVSVWYDDFELRIGDSLRGSIDHGIAHSRFGLVILSKSFFDKNWPQYELDGLVTRTNNDKTILLPIWHEITKDEVIEHSAPLADKVALRTADLGIDEIAERIASVIAGASGPPTRADTKPLPPPRTRTHPQGMNNVTLTAGRHRHFFPEVTVSPRSDRHGRYFLDVRKNDISPDEYARLCGDLATTLGTGGWHAHLDIDGLTFDFDSCEVTPNDTTRNSYYVDVRANTDASGYQQVAEALAAAATRRS